MVETKRRAVVLVSGGLDSATTLAIAREQGFETYALTLRYGQRQIDEIRCASRVVAAIGAVSHQIVTVDLSFATGSALTDSSVAVPKSRSEAEIGHGTPVTYVPARNTVFLSIALAWAETLGALDLFLGVNALDYSGYPDCRPEYLEAFQRLARLATAVGVDGAEIRIHAPLVEMTKAQIVRRALDLGVDPTWTLSCYDPLDGEPCGQCDACILRAKGFREAGEIDRRA